MALTTEPRHRKFERELGRRLIGATIGLVLAAEFVHILHPPPLAASAILLLAIGVGAAPWSRSLLPALSTVVGGLVGLKAVTLVASLAGQSSGWLAMIGFAAGAAVVLETQPVVRRNLTEG